MNDGEESIIFFLFVTAVSSFRGIFFTNWAMELINREEGISGVYSTSGHF